MTGDVVVRYFDAARDLRSLEECVAEQQDVHRALESSWPEGRAIADSYVAYLEKECAAHNGRILIAQFGQQVAGFACVAAKTSGESPDDPACFAWVFDVYVKPEHRRRGVASMLMAEAERFAQAQGATEVRLGVLERNAPARAFYARRGFRDYTRVLTRSLK